MSDPILTVSDMVAGYGRNPPILEGAEITAEAGKIQCIIGPNGAGKSTLMKSICGLVRIHSGSVKLNGDELVGLRPDQILRRGVCFVPQESALFPRMSVRENLHMGGYILEDRRLLEQRVEEVLDRYSLLRERAGQAAGTLSGGQQQLLIMARSTLTRPKVVMFDEPSLGLAPQVVAEVFRLIKSIAADGIAVLLVEQNVKVGMKYSDTGVVLDLGKTIFSAPAKQILADPRIQELYLGGRKSSEEKKEA